MNKLAAPEEDEDIWMDEDEDFDPDDVEDGV